MTAINKFNKSIIYTIRSPHTDQYYIGSTSQILCKRFVDHKTHYKYYQMGKGHFLTSFKILELGDAYIELLEEINCENRNQLEKREGELIREHKANCTNRCIPGRSIKEWVHDNVEQLKQYHAQYYKDNLNKLKQENIDYRLCNADKIKEQRKQYHIDNHDKILEKKKQYRLCNADKIKEQSKQYRLENSDKINERERAKRAEKKLLKDLESITI